MDTGTSFSSMLYSHAGMFLLFAVWVHVHVIMIPSCVIMLYSFSIPSGSQNTDTAPVVMIFFNSACSSLSDDMIFMFFSLIVDLF